MSVCNNLTKLLCLYVIIWINKVLCLYESDRGIVFVCDNLTKVLFVSVCYITKLLCLCKYLYESVRSLVFVCENLTKIVCVSMRIWLNICDLRVVCVSMIKAMSMIFHTKVLYTFWHICENLTKTLFMKINYGNYKILVPQ